MSDQQANEQQLQVIRASLVKLTEDKYQEFIKFVRELPFETLFFGESFRHLDSGLLWAKEVIRHAGFKQQNIVTAPQAPEPEKESAAVTDEHPDLKNAEPQA